MSLIAATTSAIIPGKNIIAHAREQMHMDNTTLVDTIHKMQLLSAFAVFATDVR
jgi:hypothetical protein